MPNVSHLSRLWNVLSCPKFTPTSWRVLKSVHAAQNTAATFSSSPLILNKEKSTEKTVDLNTNPFFDKYKAKIQHMQNTSPEEYEQKLQSLAESLNPKLKKAKEKSSPQAPTVVPPTETAQAGAGMTKKEGLNSVMKLELIQDKTAEEITQIWTQYHSGKDCVYAVLKADEYKNLMEKSKECPVFVYSIPRDDGFEFILSQFDRRDVYFTPLAMFQLVRENAPPCLTLNHYTELLDEKGIVLMTGQYDPKVLKQNLALSLVQQMSIFYGKNSKFYDIVHRFNYQPEKFQYQEIVDALKSLPQYDMK
ncbi:ATP synthase mitochondrial F1 complex assembly factor 1-like [Physella acuta]|uniref:ATP synthase mitochondrial F1 complex assembly factor 1-like n=1 Tax=Physella acuta TaxID=109671 RepID=UPI0027DCB195|nr:ATP synthase mitochondrial F1 complex assembly factor 1-like [Physella acuta]XP_059151872.1 ATP synthase mitochondrial F1 complex assembly factor 1-like [Physella acuta]